MTKEPIRVGQAITVKESWRGDTIRIQGREREIPRELHVALSKAAAQRRLKLDVFVALVLHNVSPSAIQQTLRKAVKPYLPADFVFIDK